jgi:hypothetical protein
MFGGYDGSEYLDDTWIYKAYSYQPGGTFISQPYDSGSKSSFKRIEWNGLEKSYLNINFQIRTAPSDAELHAKPFVGPDGSKSKYYFTPTSKLWPGHDGDRWVQCKAFLSSLAEDESPRLRNITIIYNNLPSAILSEPYNNEKITDNRRVFKWKFEDLDSISQSSFQVIIDNNSDFKTIDFDSGEQSTADTQWTFPAGTTYTKLPNGTGEFGSKTRMVIGVRSVNPEL